MLLVTYENDLARYLPMVLVLLVALVALVSVVVLARRRKQE